MRKNLHVNVDDMGGMENAIEKLQEQYRERGRRENSPWEHVSFYTSEGRNEDKLDAIREFTGADSYFHILNSNDGDQSFSEAYDDLKAAEQVVSENLDAGEFETAA